MFWIVATLVLIGCAPTTSAPGSVSKESPSNAAAPLPIRATIELGVIVQGGSSRINQWLKNQSDKEIHLTKIETSCDCLGVRLSKTILAPRDRTLACFTYDGSQEPDFVGSLLIEVTFSDGNGLSVGKIEVPVEVLSMEDYPGL